MTDGFEMEIACTNCGRAYPENGIDFRCPSCGGLFDFKGTFPFSPQKVERGQPGMWKFWHTFGLDRGTEAVSLGEGDTPLVWVEAGGRRVACKCEYQNPSGSFKDRGSAVIATWLKSRGVEAAVEDSSGNAGASFAAYAARAGIRVRIYVPESAAGPKRKQIETYGAELVPIRGTRTEVSQAAMREVEKGAAYASHAYLPFNLPGYATAAYEIYEQLGSMPGTVVAPAGQGGLLLGLSRGFDALRIAINSDEKTRMVGVQARACAPLWATFTAGMQGLGMVAENPTLAEGVRTRYPLRLESVLEAVRQSGGEMLAVDEEEILPARDALAKRGLYVEPTSAIVWAALEKNIERWLEPVVVILTGSGLKYG